MLEKAPEYAFRYGSKRKGQTFNILPSEDMFVVRSLFNIDNFIDGLSPKAGSFLDKLSLCFSFPEVKVNVFRLDKPSELASCKAAFKESPSVRFAGSVWKEQLSGIALIYTENVFIKFKSGVSKKSISSILDNHQLIIKEKFTFSPNSFFLKAQEFTGIGVFEKTTFLSQMEEVLICYPEMVFPKKTSQININQWFLKEVSKDGSNSPRGVDVAKVWHFSKGENIAIAVIDDGVDMNHPEFQLPGKIIFPRDTILDLDSAQPQAAEENHGTCCAGVALAQGSEAASGVAPMARLLPIRSGGLGSFSEAKAFAWAVDHGADIISCSWGPPDGIWYDPNDPSHRIPFPIPDSSRLAIEYALKKGRKGNGCLLIWAAGNGNEDICFDGYASLPGVLTVAACDFKEERAPYSDFGDNIACCFPSSSAASLPFTPSHGIWTTDRTHQLGYNPDGNYTASFGGTSAACPGVAGCLALVLSIYPNLQARHIKALLSLTSDKIDPAEGMYINGHSVFFGFGRINPLKVILTLKSFFSIHTELENGDSGEPKAIRFILETSIFDVILAYKLKHTDTKHVSGEWMLLPINLPIKGQMEFELLGKDAHLFMLKESFREEKGEIKLRLLWN